MVKQLSEQRGSGYYFRMFTREVSLAEFWKTVAIFSRIPRSRNLDFANLSVTLTKSSFLEFASFSRTKHFTSNFSSQLLFPLEVKKNCTLFNCTLFELSGCSKNRGFQKLISKKMSVNLYSFCLCRKHNLLISIIRVNTARCFGSSNPLASLPYDVKIQVSLTRTPE